MFRSIAKAILCVLLAAPAAGQSDAKVLSYQDFSGGLNTRVSSVLLKDNESPSLQNVVLDKSLGITKREGSTKLNSSAIGAGSSDVQAVYQLEQSDGDRYCVAFSSNAAYSSTDGCQTFAIFVGTLTRNNDVNCDAFQDRLYCVNDQYNFYFDGTNDVPFTAVADLEFIRVHRSRCFAGGRDANPSRLYWSNLADCATWTTATDYVDISPEDGDVVVAIGPPIFDMLPIYKKFSTWVLRGASGPPETWSLVNISKSIGAKDHRTIDNFGNVQLFSSLGANGGQPGIYGFDGITVKEYSEKLRGDLDLVSQFQSNIGRKAIDGKPDWDAGTFDSRALSSARSAGLIQSSYTTYTDTIGSDFSAGTLTTVSTVSISGSLTLTQADYGTFVNAGAESNAQLTNFASNSWNPTADTSMYGSYNWENDSSLACGSQFEVSLMDSSQNKILTNHYSIQDGMSVTEYTIDTSSLAYQMVRLYFKWPTSGTSQAATSAAFIRPTKVRFKLADSCSTNCCPEWDVDESVLTKSGNNVSQIFDMAISTPIWGLFQATILSSNSVSALTFEVQSSAASDGSGFESLASQSLGIEIVAAKRRYLRYKGSFSVGATTDTPAELQSATIAAASTGTWISDELFLSNQITAFGLFQCEQTTSGSEASIAWQMRSATTEAGLASATYTAETCGSAISTTANAYVQIISTYTIGVATETASTDNIIINWTEGTVARSASARVFRNRYHFGAQSPTSTFNDTIYVLDSNGAWTKWAGLRPRFLNVVSQKFVMGDSTETTGGFVYELYRTNSDNGAAIAAHWESKDLSLGPIQNVKSVDRLFLVHASSATTLTATLKADTGNRSNAYSLNLSTGSTFGVINKSMTPPLNGNTFRLRLSESGASTPWEVLGFGFAHRDLGLKQP